MFSFSRRAFIKDMGHVVIEEIPRTEYRRHYRHYRRFAQWEGFEMAVTRPRGQALQIGNFVFHDSSATGSAMRIMVLTSIKASRVALALAQAGQGRCRKALTIHDILVPSSTPTCPWS